MIDLFTLIFTRSLLTESFYFIPFAVMVISIIAAYWKPGTVTVIVGLVCAVLYGMTDNAGSGALGMYPIILMGRFAFTVSLVIFVARLGYVKKSGG